MIGWLIIACEIGFWVFVAAGLAARYVWKKKRLSTMLFVCTPLVDIILLAATVYDLKNGAAASTVHGLAAVYIGVSVAYGHQMIQWADRQFVYYFAAGAKPEKKKVYGRVRARQERAGWYRHFLAWAIGGSILGGVILYIHDPVQTEALLGTLQLWSVVLAADFLISFSYTVFPKKAKA